MSSTYLHSGSFGDTIYALNIIKLLGGDLYIQLNGMDTISQEVWGSPDSGDHKGRYTTADLDFLFPLLEKQDYVNKVAVWNNENIDHDLRYHYRFWADKHARNGRVENWQGNNTEVYGLVCGVDIAQHRKHFLVDPWLVNVDPVSIPGKPVIVNRTPRHTRREAFGLSPFHEQWDYWIKNEYLEDMAVFVGTPKEHDEFCNLYKCSIGYRPVSDMLEMAQLIKGCEQFIGNQSMPLSLAIGLGKTFWCEVRVDYETATKTPHGYGDVWFPRSNGNYF